MDLPYVTNADLEQVDQSLREEAFFHGISIVVTKAAVGETMGTYISSTETKYFDGTLHDTCCSKPSMSSGPNVTPNVVILV